MRDGWVETTLGDVAEWWSGGTPKAREPKYYENGTIPWAVIADMNKGIINSTNSNITEDALDVIGGRLAPVGSVLISMYASVGKSAIANIPLATNQAIAWSIPNQEKIIPFYLYLVSQQLEKEISDLARGATQRNINRQMLREFTFQLPPLPEQKRIVDLISSVDSYIEALQHQLESAKRSRNAVLHELLTAGGEVWVETKLGLIAEFVMGQAPLGKRCNKEGIGTPFVKAGEFGENRPEIVEWTTDPLKMAKHSDVLVCVVGATAGKINLGADCAIGRSVAAIQPSENLNQFYLYYLLSLELSNLRSGSRGSAQGVITKDDLYRIPVRLPSIEEQNVTVSIVSSIDNFIDHITSTLRHVKNLRSGLLSDLLSGDHEIPESYDKVIGAA
jgi:restriction endonuclease S subunit